MDVMYFFYSAEQDAVKRRNANRERRQLPINHVVDSEGKIHEFTMQSPKRHPDVGFKDLQFICEATKNSVIHNGRPQGEWAKAHLHKL
jgi:hypothetical protein